MVKKKQKYRLPEHEQHHNRVDIFRSVQTPFSAQQNQNINSNLTELKVKQISNSNLVISGSERNLDTMINNVIPSTYSVRERNNDTKYDVNKKMNSSYNNKAYVTSNTNLNKGTVNSIESSKINQTVWTTTGSSYLPRQHQKANQADTVSPRDNDSGFYSKSDNHKSSSASTAVPASLTKSKSKKKKLLIIAGVLLVLSILALVIGLALYFASKQMNASNAASTRECSPECGDNRYCVLRGSSSTQTSTSNATCICKPGYTLNALNNKCEQSVCYSNYKPYTYVNNQEYKTTGLPYETKYLKPYCCTNENFLTSTSCCGVSAVNKTFSISKRIIGGQIMEDHAFPWIVFITQMYRSTSNKPLAMIKNCSGSLISDRHVLTAAHCIDLDSNTYLNGEFPTKESIFRVYFGFTDKSQAFTSLGINRSMERRVQKLTVHANYNPTTLENDIAILQLDRPIPRSNTVDYICLFNYASDDSLVQRRKLYTAGWGSTSPNYLNLQYPELLYYVDAVVFPMTSCNYIIPDKTLSYLFNPKTHVCAGYDLTIGKDTCYGDSGTPLMVEYNGQWFVYGIVTYGSQPNCAQGPSMYIRVSFYYQWIMSNT